MDNEKEQRERKYVDQVCPLQYFHLICMAKRISVGIKDNKDESSNKGSVQKQGNQNTYIQLSMTWNSYYNFADILIYFVILLIFRLILV